MRQLSGLKIKAFNDLIKASGILFLASGFANIFNLLFVLFMVRNLQPADYGVLNALFSLLMILSMPASTLQMVVTKYVAHHFGKKEFGLIKSFIFHFGKRIILLGMVFLIIFWVLTPFIAGFLKINSFSLIIVSGGILFLSIISPLAMGVLQGAQRFLVMAINGLFGSALKLILGIVLVALGFKVMGAIAGAGLAALLALILAYFQLPSELLKAKESYFKELRMKSVYQYSVPVFFSLLGWMVLTNGDVILVKHFFSPEDAGFYSVAQIIGKIILFLPGVIGVVLFPMMSEAFSHDKATKPLLKKGLIIAALLCVCASLSFSLAPGLALKILTRKEAAEAV
ncbi:MAG: oligosaccharide flippase family protein, partial [Candidatus Omnitrophota bacterium]|nr:oligosaccharide flippase family protein [Candidatus Omnitrophota bacterium]